MKQSEIPLLKNQLRQQKPEEIENYFKRNVLSVLQRSQNRTVRDVADTATRWTDNLVTEEIVTAPTASSP